MSYVVCVLSPKKSIQCVCVCLFTWYMYFSPLFPCSSMKAPNRANTIDYYTQASFAVGVLVCEMATGSHPLPDYPLGYTNNGAVSFSSEDVAPLPAAFPKSFCSIVMDLLSPTQRKRLPISEALNQLRVCCMRRSSSSSASASASLSSSSQLTDYRRLERERDLAKVSSSEEF